MSWKYNVQEFSCLQQCVPHMLFYVISVKQIFCKRFTVFTKLHCLKTFHAYRELIIFNLLPVCLLLLWKHKENI